MGVIGSWKDWRSMALIAMGSGVVGMRDSGLREFHDCNSGVVGMRDSGLKEFSGVVGMRDNGLREFHDCNSGVGVGDSKLKERRHSISKISDCWFGRNASVRFCSRAFCSTSCHLRSILRDCIRARILAPRFPKRFSASTRFS